MTTAMMIFISKTKKVFTGGVQMQLPTRTAAAAARVMAAGVFHFPLVRLCLIASQKSRLGEESSI